MPDSTSSSCGPNKEFSQGLCQNRCRDGFTGKGSSCQKQCPTTGQYLSLGPLCQKVPLKRPSGTVPFIQNCPNGYNDNGRDCISPLKCAWPNQCTGTNLPAITFAQRLMCYGANQELINGLCYTKCPKGQTGNASSCLPNCPDDFQDTDPFQIGSHCVKPSYGRGLGEPPAQSPIQTIAKSPNGSTFLERYRAGITPANVSEITNSGVFGGTLGDPGQPGVDNQAESANNFFNSTVSGSAKTLGSWYNTCQPPDPYGSGPISNFIWNIVWPIILIVIIGVIGFIVFQFGGSYITQFVDNLFGVFGAVVRGTGGVVVTATTAVGQETQAVVQQAGGVTKQLVSEAGTVAGQTAQSLGTVVSGVGRGAGTAISGVAQGVGTGVSGLARGFGTGVSGVAQGVGTGLRGIERGTGEALAGIPEAVNILAPATAAAGQNVAAAIAPGNTPIGQTPIQFASKPFLPVEVLPGAPSTLLAPGVVFNQ